MPSEQFSRHELESSILSTCPDEEPLQPRPLGELIERYGEQMVEERVHARRSVRELAQWMPPGLHAAIGPLEMGQQQLAWAIAREVAAQNGRVLFFSLDLSAPALLRFASGSGGNDERQGAVQALAKLPIEVVDKPAIGLDDIDLLLEREPAWKLVVIDSFARIVPPHSVGYGHFARWGLAIGLAALAKYRQVALLVTGVAHGRCPDCGAPSPWNCTDLASDPTGLAHEAHYLWRVDREAYWFLEGRRQLDVTVVGRDGTRGWLSLDFDGGVLFDGSDETT